MGVSIPYDPGNTSYRFVGYVFLGQVSNREFSDCQSEKRIEKTIFSLPPQGIFEF